MGFSEIFLIGIALSMDACGVSISNALAFKDLKKKKIIATSLLFGIFQGIMPLIGYFAGGIFSSFIIKWSKFVIFIILGILGFKMLIEGFSQKEETTTKKSLTVKTMFLQAIATSIDAFAVGITFNVSNVNIFLAVSIIAFTTAIMCLIASLLAKKFGHILKDKAIIFGGILLIVIAIKALF